jgi:hypothetical protein
VATRIGYRIKKLLKAAGRAAKGKGPLPPQLWKVQHAAPPGWSEFDRMSYREVTLTTALQNVYDVVKAWTTGHTDKDTSKYYARLVRDGIVGKNI